jgi:transglutaminase-like putative cysteine protease
LITLRLINWFIDKIGLRTLLALLLLFVALGTMIWTLAGIVRGLGLELLLFTVFWGALLGWGLAAWRPIPGWLAGFLALILGVEAIVVRVGQLGGILLALGQHLISLAWQIWRWPLDGQPDPSPLGPAWLELEAGLSTLLARGLAWTTALANGEPAFDPVTTTLIWSLVLWGISVWAGWGIRRLEQPLAALAPTGALLATTLAYSSSQPANLLLLLGSTLLLMGLIGYQARRRRWLAAGLDCADTIQLDLAFVVIPIAAMLLLAAGIVPSISVQQMTKLARQLLGDQTAQAAPMAGSLGLRPGPNQSEALHPFRAPGLPRSHLLGSGPELSEQVALVIDTGPEPGGAVNSAAGRPAARYYWRSITYDSYNGWGWFTSPTEQFEYEAGEAAISAKSATRHLLRQNVQIVSNQGGLLYAAGDVVAANHPYSIDWRGPGDPFAALVGTTSYQVDSLIPATGEAELRTAGSDYPDWIRRRFLHLPDSVPERVLVLARDLTATAPTPYDRARAIEAYLRTFPYTLDLPQPPTNQDMVDYFLFDLQQGYCDYYATSMVVLARAAGLPARLAIGYASGTYYPEQAQYVVTEADAHSWVEIYFPEYGWIDFEPTAAQPVTDRSGQVPRPEPPTDALSLPADTPLQALESRFSWWLLLSGGLALLAAGGMSWLLVDGWRLRRLAPAAAVVTVYERLYRYAHWLAVPLWPGDTPYEFAVTLAKYIDTLAQGKRWQAVLAPIKPEVQRLTKLYIETAYSEHPPNEADRRQAIQIWQRLRQRLWLAWVTTLNFHINRR